MLEPLVISAHCKTPITFKKDDNTILLTGTILNRKNIIFYQETKEVLYERIVHKYSYGNLDWYQKEIDDITEITHRLIHVNFLKKSIKGILTLTKNRTKLGKEIRELIDESIPLYPVIKAYSLYDKETNLYHIYDICSINLDTKYESKISQKNVLCINDFDDFRKILERKLKIAKITNSI